MNAHQARETGPLGSEQPTYKYGFEEFEGRAGKLLLDRIIRTILPPGLARTWEIIFDIPATYNDHAPYVGTQTIATQAGRSLRVIEDDLKRLRDMNLLTIFPDIVPDKSGKPYAVERKDFSNLYKLAHEYLLWEQSNGFRMYPPDKRYIDLIKANREIYNKLVRFDNYKRVLENKKTGPRQKNFEAPRWTDQEDQESTGILGGANNSLLLSCDSRDKLIPASTYESNCNNIIFDKDSNLSYENNFDLEDSPPSHEEDFRVESGKGSEAFSFEIPKSPSKSEKPKVQRNAREVAKSAEAQRFGEEVVKRSIGKAKFKKDKKWEERNANAKERDALLKRCQSIVNVMQDISNELNDQGGRSTDTRIAKLFEQSKLTEEQFIEMMYYARGKVKSIPATQIKVRGMNGQPNRVPLFMSLVEQTIEKGLEAMQAADAEYEASREERKAEEQDRQTEKPEPEFDEPETVAQVEEPEVEQTEEPEPVAQEPEINPEYENWHNQLEATAKEIKTATGLNAYVGGECQCGCKIKIRVGWKPRCAWCERPESWSGEIHAWIANAIRDVYEMGEAV